MVHLPYNINHRGFVVLDGASPTTAKDNIWIVTYLHSLCGGSYLNKLKIIEI